MERNAAKRGGGGGGGAIWWLWVWLSAGAVMGQGPGYGGGVPGAAGVRAPAGAAMPPAVVRGIGSPLFAYAPAGGPAGRPAVGGGPAGAYGPSPSGAEGPPAAGYSPPPSPGTMYASPPPPPTTMYASPPPGMYYASPPPPPYTPPPPMPGYYYPPMAAPTPAPAPSAGGGYCPPYSGPHSLENDLLLLNKILKLQYLLADFYLFSAFHRRLDHFNSNLPSHSLKISSSSRFSDRPFFSQLVAEFGLQSLSYISTTLELLGSEAAPRPKINIGKSVFNRVMYTALDRKLDPQFDPYANSTNFLLAAFATGPALASIVCSSALPQLQGSAAKSHVAELLATFSGEDAVIQTLMLEKKHDQVSPYSYTVSDFAAKVSTLRELMGAKKSDVLSLQKSTHIKKHTSVRDKKAHSEKSKTLSKVMNKDIDKILADFGFFEKDD